MTADDVLEGVTRYAKDVAILKTQRDKGMKLARDLGKSVKEIADAALMSRQGATKVLARMLDNSVDKEHN